jgi:hypothetical protein
VTPTEARDSAKTVARVEKRIRDMKGLEVGGL